MWVTADGVMHTCAYADPLAAMSDDFSISLVEIARAEGPVAYERVSEAEDRLLDRLSETPALLEGVTAGLEEQWPPDEYLRGTVRSSAELIDYLAGIELDWRVEAFEVVGEVLSDLTAGGTLRPSPGTPLVRAGVFRRLARRWSRP